MMMVRKLLERGMTLNMTRVRSVFTEEDRRVGAVYKLIMAGAIS